MKCGRRNAVKFSALLLATAVGSISMPARALFGFGGVLTVIDPTNLVENVTTAIQTANSVREQIKANLAEFTFNNTFGASPEMGQMLQILDGANTMVNALMESRRVLNDLTNAFGASPYENWSGFVAGIHSRREAGDKQATSLLDSAFAADKQVRSAYDVNRRIQESARSVNGPTEAIQAMVNAVGVVIDQNNNMLYGMSSSNKSQAQEVARQAAEREQREKADKKYREDVKRVNQMDTEILNRMGIRVAP